MNSKEYEAKIKTYYDYTLNLYKFFWHGETRGIHYGIWDHSTKTLQEALINTNRVLAEAAKIKLGEKVLDAGCGVGGSSFWLVRNRGVYATGITLSEKQLYKAQGLRQRYGLQAQTDFQFQNYLRTTFPDASFDVVWAIESVCYALDKSEFLKEAYRLLRSGGRVAIADGFLERAPHGAEEEQKLNNFLKGWALSNLASPVVFEKAMREVGFAKLQNIDKTDSILPTAKKMLRMSCWSWPLSLFTTALGITPSLLVDNNRAGIDQFDLFQSGVLTYRIFVGEK